MTASGRDVVLGRGEHRYRQQTDFPQMADQVATLIRLHKEAVAEHVLGLLLAIGDLETQPGAKLSRGGVNADVPASLAMENS